MSWLLDNPRILAGLIAGVFSMIFLVVAEIPAIKKMLGGGAKYVPLILAVLATNWVLPSVKTELRVRNVESELLSQELYQVIKQQEPELYNRIVDICKNGVKKGKTADEINPVLRSELMPYYKKRIAYSSDEVILGSSKVFIAQLREVLPKNANVCYRLMYPSKTEPITIKDYVSPDLIKLDEKLFVEVFKTSYKSTLVLPTEKEAEAALSKVITKLFLKYGAKAVTMMDEKNESKIDKKLYCTITISIFEETLNLPESERIHLLRYLFA